MTTAMLTPSRSREQRLVALDEANRVRCWRARFKRELHELGPAEGSRRLKRVLLDPPVELRTAHVLDVLVAVPKIGRVKANKILFRAKTSPSKTLGGLSSRQRLAVSLELHPLAD